MHIVIAEDDREMRSLLAAVLEQGGAAVEEVDDGTTLLERVSAWRDGDEEAPDLVVTDIQMPGCNGLGVVGELRRWNHAMPVIVITAFGDPRTHEKARALGVHSVLDKPFDLADFSAAVERAVAREPVG